MRTKIIQGKNYGSIPHFSTSKLGKHDRFIHEGQERIMRNGGRDKHDVVIVSIKLDGTNVGVLKRDGQLVTLQRKGYDCASSPYRQHHEFDKWMHENYERFDALLNEGERVVGEWMWQASGIRYKIKGAPFFAFDLFDAENNRNQWAELEWRCEDVGIKRPASARYSDNNNAGLGQFMDLAAKFPFAVPIDEEHEGAVVRVERKGQFDFMAKWVRPDYISGKYLPGLNENSPKEITINHFV